MICIRWSNGEADLEGSPNDLLSLHQRLLAFASTKEPTLQIEANGAVDPYPYEKALGRLTVEKSQAQLNAQILNGALHVSGKPELLALLAKNIPHSQERSNTSVAYHVHFDRASQPAQVHERSASLVFTVTK